MRSTPTLIVSLLLALPLLALPLARAFAAPPSKAAPQPSQPQVTTTSYGDWALRCQQQSNAGKGPMCEAAVTIQQKDQPAPIAKFALGRPSPAAPFRAIILLPTNISLPSTVKLFTDDKDAWGLDFVWRRCVPGGCFAEVMPSEDDLGRWRKIADSAKIIFKDAEGRDISLPIPFRGFGQALDALTKN
jgi:invasion protein IalB